MHSTTSDCSEVLQAALSLAAAGIPNFPCSDRKTPTTRNGYKDATTDRRRLAAFWHRHPGQLIGVPCGAITGFDVLDIDPRHGGDAWFEEHRHRLPRTRIHETRSGGMHIFFEHAAGAKCSAGRIATGVDVRADGGYVIWWPESGFTVIEELSLASWPGWLLKNAAPRPAPLKRSSATLLDSADVRPLLRRLVFAPVGQRNNLTFWIACRAGELCRAGKLDERQAVYLIADAATRAGLPRAEAERTAQNGIRAGRGLK